MVSSGRRSPGHRLAMPVEKPKDSKRTLIRLWRYLGKENKRLAVLFLFILVDAAIGLSIPYLTGRAVDAMSSGLHSVNFTLLGFVIWILGAVYVADAIVVLLQGYMMAGVSQRVISSLRHAMFSKLQKLPIAFFDRHTHGELMSRLSNDIDNISSSISQSMTNLVSGTIAIAGSLILMLMLSPWLTLASLVTVPMVFALTRTIAKRTRALFKEQQVELGKLNGHIEETVSGLHVVKAFSHEAEVIKTFEQINTRLCKVGLRAQIWSGYLMPIMNVINNFGFAVIAGVGGILAVHGMITIGVIASFLGYSRQFTRPLNDLANIFNAFQSALAGAERLFEVLDEGEEPEDDMDAIDLERPKGHVVFENVTFGYRPDVDVLKHIDFEAAPGSNIALVGQTGAGKTTIASLLARLYDVREGRILIDGRDIRTYSRGSLRRCFGIVLQDTYLFSGTIKENIRYGKPGAADQEVYNAAVMANADAFIRRLPKGYDTVLSESGGNLSQGQRQLLAIARAILSDPAILILDEATSSVDTRTELNIQEAMLTLMKGRTSFIIAHRLSTIKDADRILVIDNGEIVEAGSHDALIAYKGRYHDMYINQYKNIGIV